MKIETETDQNWYVEMATDSTGQYVMACVAGRFYKSSNYGVDWTEWQPPEDADLTRLNLRYEDGQWKT